MAGARDSVTHTAAARQHSGMALSLTSPQLPRKNQTEGSIPTQVVRDAGGATYTVGMFAFGTLVVLAGLGMAARMGWLPLLPGTRTVVEGTAALTDDLGTRLG